LKNLFFLIVSIPAIYSVDVNLSIDNFTDDGSGTVTFDLEKSQLLDYDNNEIPLIDSGVGIIE